MANPKNRSFKSTNTTDAVKSTAYCMAYLSEIFKLIAVKLRYIMYNTLTRPIAAILYAIIINYRYAKEMLATIHN